MRRSGWATRSVGLSIEPVATALGSDSTLDVELWSLGLLIVSPTQPARSRARSYVRLKDERRWRLTAQIASVLDREK